MTLTTAQHNIDTLSRKSVLTPEEEFVYTESYRFIIKTTHDPKAMLYLGGYYYEEKNFGLAKKYYEMAAKAGDMDAIECLGYIYYYGRVGNPDYEKAYYYYSKAAEAGNLEAATKIADMYHNGYFVAKDEAEYAKRIEALYLKIQSTQNLGDPYPEITGRYAAIKAANGDTKTAIALYRSAREFLAQRIHYNPFWGNLSIMQTLLKGLYALTPFDPKSMDVFDLYEVGKAPHEVHFRSLGKSYQISFAMNEGHVIVKFLNKAYPSVEDFMRKALLGGEMLVTERDQLYYWEVA